MLLYLIAFLGYPIAISFSESHSLILTSKGIFYSTLILLTFCIVQIVNFIPQFFKLSNMEMERANPEETQVAKESEGDVDYVVEKAALRAHLVDHGLIELDNDVEFLDGTLFLNFLDHTDHHEAWFNINIAVRNSNVFDVRNTVLNYASRLFGLLRESLVDINVFVLSFHIRLGGERTTRNVFFRSTRSELNEILSNAGSPRTAIMKIKNKLFDEIFRDLDQGEN